MKLFQKKINYIPDQVRCKDTSEKSNIIIHHYCPHTFNAGDHFVIRSIRKHLKKQIPNALFVPKAVAGNRGWGKPIGLKGINIPFSNEFADAVVLGGSDQYNNWSPDITAEEIQHLIPPLFLIGLGVSSKDINQPPYIKEEKKRSDILATNRKAALSSVRDNTTNDFLKELGYGDAIVTGCPALFMFDKEIALQAENKPILFTFPYPLSRNIDQQHKFQVLIKAVRPLMEDLRSKGKECIVVCHDDRDVQPAQELFPDFPLFFSNYVDDFFELYANSKFVVGSRLHATILASGLGIPSININLDLRGTGYSKTFSLQEWNIDYFDKDLKEKLFTRTSEVLNGDISAFSNFSKIRSDYYMVFEKFISDTASIILKK